MKVDINIVNLDKIVEKYETFGKKGRDAAAELVFDVSSETAEQAKKNARGQSFDRGSLVQGIYVKKRGEMDADVIASAAHSGYVEFGTGAQVKVPPAFQSIATKIRSRPKKDGALQAIREWCKRKGIDEKAAWPILMAILKRGLTPKPFFYPAFLFARGEIKRKAKIILKQLKEDF